MANARVEGLLVRAYAGEDVDKLKPGELEELAAEIARRKEEPNEHTEIVKQVEKRLQAYYKSLASSTGKEVLERVPAKKAGLPAIPILPQPPPSMGDINLLMTDVPLTLAPFSDAVIKITTDMVERTDGVIPEIAVRFVVQGKNQVPRIIARWEIRRTVSADELHTMLLLLRAAYEQNVTGYKANGEGWEAIGSYQDARARVPDSGRQGIYMGPSTFYSTANPGLFVYRKFKSKAEADHLRRIHPIDWLSRSIGPTKRTTTVLEFSDAGKQKEGPGLGQDAFIVLVAQLSFLLRHRALIEGPALWTAVFRELNRVGTRALDRDSLYGMGQTLGAIERVMLLPYEKPELASLLRIQGESVLLVGVPGVGKTMMEHHLMASEHNVIFAAVDSDALRSDLAKVAEGKAASSILMRVDRIMRRSTLPAILIIDDIDVLLQEEGMVSKFLNMMQGIRQKGLLVLASTNYREKIDPRLLEPGRLSKVVHVPLPDLAARRGVLLSYLVHLPFASREERGRVIDKMAGQTEGWSHRYLWELIQEAARVCAIETTSPHPSLTLEHFECVLPELSASVELADLKSWDGRIKGMIELHAKMGFALSI